jgi:hypothetical protein
VIVVAVLSSFGLVGETRYLDCWRAMSPPFSRRAVQVFFAVAYGKEWLVVPTGPATKSITVNMDSSL